MRKDLIALRRIRRSAPVIWLLGPLAIVWRNPDVFMH
jgi:hypothetical protein